MTKISNNFLIGTVNKDLDERLVPMGQLTDASNVSAITSEEGQKGVVKNVLGNVKKTTITTTYSITNPKTVGKATISSKSLVYNFVCGDNHDAIIEYNALTNATAIVLKSATGGALNFSKTKRIKASDIIVTGEDQGDLLAWTDGVNPPRIINIKRFKDYFTANPSYAFTSAEISVIKPSPIYAPTLEMVLTENVYKPFLNDKFIEFAYRYKYNDGYYSAVSSWSEVAFMPKKFLMDYQTYENNGMLNLFNSVNVSFNTGPRDVIGIDLLFKESNNNTVYIIDKFLKSEEGWGNSVTQVFNFNKSKTYAVLPEAQYYRNFDNVPLLANAQTLIGNRLMYGDFTEGRNIPEHIDFDVDYTSLPLYSDIIADTSENYNGVTSYSNLVDFEEGGYISGTVLTSPINYSTNALSTYQLDSSYQTRFTFTITPYAGYTSSIYSLRVVRVSDSSVVYSQLNKTGNNSFIFNSYGTTPQYLIYIDGPVLYDLKTNWDVYQVVNFIVYPDPFSRYEFKANHQLSYPASSGTDYTQGNIIVKATCKYDFTTFQFKAGKQLIFNFELDSSLVDFVSTPTYAYTLSTDYSSLADFITNSDFKYNIETTFSNTFKTSTEPAFISNEGTIVTFTGFKVSYSGSFLSIVTPVVRYNVTEYSGIVENKYEFFIIDNIDLVVASSTAYRSMHSNRDYEVCLIYLDEEGRKTTALTSKDNSIFIGPENSDTVNLLKININNTPPTWAKKYKFGIKQTNKDYQIIYANLIYKDGIYRWIRLEGESVNKVAEGDILIVKSDLSGVRKDPVAIKVKVIEVADKVSDFIPDNELPTGGDLIEKSGKYIKIKQGAFDLIVDEDSVKTFSGSVGQRYPSSNNTKVTTSPGFGEIDGTAYVPYAVKTGSSIVLDVNIKAYGSIAFNHNYHLDTVAYADYPSFYAWFNAEVVGTSEWNKFSQNNPANGGYLKAYGFIPKTVNGITYQDKFWVTPWRDGTASRDIYTDVNIDVNFSRGTLIFETEPELKLDNLYFETPETFDITGGAHQANPNILTRTFNCFAFGNGVESYQIQDGFNRKVFGISNNPTAVSEDKYRQINRFADLTYSEILQESTNVNRLNEFNLYLANYKDDMEKSFGRITNIKGFDTNIDVIQEDKYSVVYYGKDLLYNADGTTNLQKIPQVLGQQKALDGEFGSQSSDGFDFYGGNRFFPDIKRGTIMQKSNQGLVSISNYGMNYYFTKLFRDNVINNIIGEYDQHLNVYIINIKYNTNQYVTWLYSDESNGWVTTQTFNPEDMCRMNGEFYSFYNGEVYRHNDSTNYNTFYGTLYDSSLSFNMNVEPGTRKVFRTLSTEGTDSWAATCITDQQNGHIDIADYQNKEGVRYAYVRGDDTGAIDTATPAVQGIGVITSISGLNVITGVSVPNLVNIGDKVYKSNMAYIGTITAILSNGVTLSSVVGLSNGDFIISVKNQSIETSGLLGYYMNVTLRLSGKNTRSELYQVNSEVSKSFM